MLRENLPPSILRSIIDRAVVDLQTARQRESMEDLQSRLKSAPPARDFAAALSARFGLIAEIKQKSPSKGMMRHRDVEGIARIYNGSSAVQAVSVLTNQPDFGMCIADLERVRRIVHQPVLRKDFIFDPYQVVQARAYGADAILLMANVLTKKGLHELSSLAQTLGLAVLFESHTTDEIQKIPKDARIWGINSRKFVSSDGTSNRATYFVSRTLGWLLRRDLSIKSEIFDLVNELPAEAIKVAESGVDSSMVAKLKDELGFNSLLVGTSLLMSPRGVADALQGFEKAIEKLNLPLSARTGRRLQHSGA